jgi:hypothetical protein
MKKEEQKLLKRKTSLIPPPPKAVLVHFQWKTQATSSFQKDTGITNIQDGDKLTT